MNPSERPPRPSAQTSAKPAQAPAQTTQARKPAQASAARGGRHAAAKPSGGTSAPRRAAAAPKRAAKPGSARKTGSAAKTGATRGGAHARKRPSRGARLRRFWRRYRILLLIACAVLILAVALACLLPVGSEPGSAPAPSPTATLEATPLPTAEPSVAPSATPEPTEEPAPTIPPEERFAMAFPTDFKVVDGAMQTTKAIGLPEGPKVDDSYFNDTVFVGDSITLRLRQYVLEKRKEYPTLLGNATFVTTGGFSIHEVLEKVSENSLHPVYQGEKMLLEDLLAKCGAKKVYIMLGVNDASYSGVNEAVANMGKLVTRIREKNPGIEVFIQSATPRMRGENPATGTLFKYDLTLYQALLQYKLEDVYFVDVAYVMRASNGLLRADYCSDPDGMAMHFTDKACKQWINYLYTHTAGGQGPQPLADA